MGLQARLMSQALRKLTGIIKKSNTAAIFINQLRDKVGIVWGSTETTTGGRALKFYSTIRMEIRRIDSVKDGKEIKGNRTRAKIVKNKLAPPFKMVEFDIIYGEGISSDGDLIDVAVEEDVIQKSGAWYSYNGERLGQGREKVKLFLQDNPEVRDEIKAKIQESFKRSNEPEELKSEDIETKVEDDEDDFDLGKMDF